MASNYPMDPCEDQNKEMLEILECPTCFEYMDDIIQLCYVGHSVCGRCREELKTCPICRSRFSNARNYLLERMSKVCRYPCKYSDNGCLEFSKKYELKTHEELCKWKPYSCRLKLKDDKPCSWAGRRCDIDEHCESAHNLICWMEEESLDRWKPGVNDNLEVQMMHGHGEKFYLTRILKDAIMYWTLNYIGIDSEAKNFQFKLKFTKDDTNRPSIKMEAPCHPFDKSTDEIIANGECIGIPVGILLKYKNKLDSICFKIQVNRSN